MRLILAAASRYLRHLRDRKAQTYGTFDDAMRHANELYDAETDEGGTGVD